MKYTFLLLLIFVPLLHSCDFTDSEILDRLEEIRSQNVDLAEEIRRLQAKTDSLLNQMEQNSDQHGMLAEKVDELQAQMGKVLDEMNETSTLLSEASSERDQLRSQLSGLQRSYDDLFRELQQLQTLSQILIRLEAIRERMADLESGTDQVLQIVGDYRAEVENAFSEIETQLNQNQESIAQLTALLQDQDADMERILQELESLQESNASLLSDMEALLEINQVFRLEDGTVTCPTARPGDKGYLEGKIYEAVDRELLIERRDQGADLTCLCTTLVTDMSYIFAGFSFNEDISDWDVSNVTNMEYMFSGSEFNQPISSWDVSNVTNMNNMFQESSFNQPIGAWDVGNVETMRSMFLDSPFNHRLDSWNVSNVTRMHYMFDGSAFNHPIGNWDVSNVVDMTNMFARSPFDQPIGSWDVSSGENMDRMFFNASSFNQDLSGWCVQLIPAEPSNFSLGSGMRAENLPIWGTCPN